MWLGSLCLSMIAKSSGFPQSVLRGSDDQIAWWALNQPIVTGLIRHAQVTVLCDPERSEHGPGQPAVLWGWMVSAGDVVYGLGVKRSVRRASLDLAMDVARELLGERIQHEHTQVMSLVDLGRLGLIPPSWSLDLSWWETMRRLVAASLDKDQTTASVVAHIMSPTREHWVPNSQRAA